MKKFLPILLAGFVAITVVACGGEEDLDEVEEETTEEAPTGDEEAPTGDEAAPTE